MEHTNKPNDWLQISLRSAKLTVDKVLTIDICFKNIAGEMHVLTFSNRSRKAELLGLHVFDDMGQAIMPERRNLILLKDNKVEEHVIAAGEEWVYTLTGKICEGFLEYQGAAYRLPRKQILRCYFEFQGVKSNSLTIYEPNKLTNHS